MRQDTEPDTALFDEWTRAYALLGLRFGRLAPDIVDAWIGPASWRDAVDRAPVPTPDALGRDAEALLQRLPAMGYTADRTAYLERQVGALHAQARILSGDALSLREQAIHCFDISIRPRSEDTFAAAHAELDRLLPGNGAIHERRAAWLRRFQVPPARLLPVLPTIADEVRRRTRARLPVPPGESIDIALTANQPWSAYNWYQGAYHSRIELNTDLPLQADEQVEYLCHEGYPGHHTERVIREAVQYRAGQQGEYAIQLLTTPETVISEAIATSARERIFSGDEDLVWMAEAVFPHLGIAVDPIAAGRIRDASEPLRHVSGNAAVLCHEQHLPAAEVVAYLERWSLCTHEEAVQQFRFLASPIGPAYVFTYTYGYDLLKPLLSGPDGDAEFAALLSNPTYPDLLRRRAANREVSATRNAGSTR